MLGETIGEERGQITGMRLLPSKAGMLWIKASFQASGRLLDTEMIDLGTYWSVARPDRRLFGPFGRRQSRSRSLANANTDWGSG